MNSQPFLPEKTRESPAAHAPRIEKCGEDIYNVWDSQGNYVAKAFGYENARLIDTAPELYRELKKLHFALKHDLPYQLDAAEQAIATAEGRG